MLGRTRAYPRHRTLAARYVADPQFRLAAKATGTLRRWNRLRLNKEAGRPCDTKGAAMQAVDCGIPELAEAAADFPDRYHCVKAGNICGAKDEDGPIAWADLRQARSGPDAG